MISDQSRTTAREPRTLTAKRAAALMEFASWPETRQYLRKEVSMRALQHLGLVLSVPGGGWLLTDHGRRIVLAMLDIGKQMIEHHVPTAAGKLTAAISTT